MNQMASRQSPIGTIMQVLPKVGSVLRNLRPTWHLHSLDLLDPDFVARHRIKALIWDVDGTLTNFHDTTVADAASAFLALATIPGLQHAILSNAGEDRFRELGTIFPEISVLKGYWWQEAVALRQILRGEDSWTAVQVSDRVAAGAMPLRKPHGELVLAVTRHLGLAPQDVVMVGDQYFTDIAGANLAGVRSIKLPAIGPETLPPSIRMGQVVERLVYRLLHGAPVWERPRAGHAAREG
ncbi:MAG: HAD hydrolase-like protein [Gemmatimonadales bacterium]|jgi:HAD superfamily phosphatase (TIGR01668 family)|nr:HAD hydrolase-like protein [Gemmatimonadales bacterium]MBP6570107.1 HAD hydrolase-like protein [Gemmatimonadales bacterium]MBP7619466.1 HAD hydrolase-like protein [Gemmatimonadales bacterium]MBP9897978.1 HAD hydrolase-like protein [Gemmatimonadales bacterium]